MVCIRAHDLVTVIGDFITCLYSNSSDYRPSPEPNQRAHILAHVLSSLVAVPDHRVRPRSLCDGDVNQAPLPAKGILLELCTPDPITALSYPSLRHMTRRAGFART